ncbi:MAG: hypothetical protein JWP37_2312 [Mucilaginibacter sp.]|nr:hypothetical protein [Mucilaginibacter sp.]
MLIYKCFNNSSGESTTIPVSLKSFKFLVTIKSILFKEFAANIWMASSKSLCFDRRLFFTISRSMGISSIKSSNENKIVLNSASSHAKHYREYSKIQIIVNIKYSE